MLTFHHESTSSWTINCWTFYVKNGGFVDLYRSNIRLWEIHGFMTQDSGSFATRKFGDSLGPSLPSCGSDPTNQVSLFYPHYISPWTVWIYYISIYIYIHCINVYIYINILIIHILVIVGHWQIRLICQGIQIYRGSLSFSYYPRSHFGESLELLSWSQEGPAK